MGPESAKSQGGAISHLTILEGGDAKMETTLSYCQVTGGGKALKWVKGSK